MNTLDNPNGHALRAELQSWFPSAQLKLEHGGLTLLWPDLDDLTIRVAPQNSYKKDTVGIHVRGKEGLFSIPALAQLKRQLLIQASGRPQQIQPKRVALAVAKLYTLAEPYHLYSQGVIAAALKALASAGYDTSGQPALLKLGDLHFSLHSYWTYYPDEGTQLHLQFGPRSINLIGTQRVARYAVRLGQELDSAEFLRQVQELREHQAREEQEGQARELARRAAKSLEAKLRTAYPEVDDEVIRARTENEVVITARCSEAMARKILDLLIS
jgi:hypothetical protein